MDETTQYAVISEARGLVWLGANEEHAEDFALRFAVNTGHTTYVKPASEVR